MQVSAVSPTSTNTSTSGTSSTSGDATSAFGLGFDSLLKIVLTQLTYQDPMKPMDNFQFVSQLAQFSQIQIGQTTNDRLQTLVTAQGTLQAAGLLGRQVDINAGAGTGTTAATVTGKVIAVTFNNGDPRITIQTGDNQTISDLTLASVSQIREGN